MATLIRAASSWLTDHPRQALAVLALAACGVATASILLTHWLRLNPCYLCIFQRLLSIKLALCFGLGALLPWRSGRQIFTLFAGLIALCGLGAAGFQSWEQWYPEVVGSCVGTEPNLIERLVEWMGSQWPSLFMVSGLCESKELEILGLSLANWSFLAFTGFAMAAFYLLWLGLKQNR